MKTTLLTKNVLLFLSTLFFLSPCAVFSQNHALSKSEEQNFFLEDVKSYSDEWGQRLKISQTHYEGKSDYQKIAILENPIFGRFLVLDGVVQVTERDDPYYHEMLVHVPMLAHGAAKKVLIIGGGDGGCLREVLRHQTVEKAVMVDLDGAVVELSKKYLPTISKGAFDDPRAQVLIQNGIDYVNNTQEKFDIIFSDCTDPNIEGPGAILFSSEFYKNCKKILNSDGILVTQNGVPFDEETITKQVYKNLAENFSDTRLYVTVVPVFAGGFMSFGWATDNPQYCKVSTKTLTARMRALGGTMTYYNPQIHKASFTLPQCIKALTQ